MTDFQLKPRARAQPKTETSRLLFGREFPSQFFSRWANISPLTWLAVAADTLNSGHSKHTNYTVAESWMSHRTHNNTARHTARWCDDEIKKNSWILSPSSISHSLTSIAESITSYRETQEKILERAHLIIVIECRWLDSVFMSCDELKRREKKTRKTLFFVKCKPSQWQ